MIPCTASALEMPVSTSGAGRQSTEVQSKYPESQGINYGDGSDRIMAQVPNMGVASKCPSIKGDGSSRAEVGNHN